MNAEGMRSTKVRIHGDLCFFVHAQSPLSEAEYGQLRIEYKRTHTHTSKETRICYHNGGSLANMGSGRVDKLAAIKTPRP